MKKMKFILSCLGLIALTMQPIAALGEVSPKEEVIYGLLNTDGTVKSITVVNVFSSGTILDYGNYSKVLNLTTQDPLVVTSDKIEAVIPADRVYVQGNLNILELPWEVQISMTLNDQAVDPQTMGGKSGQLKIRLKVVVNPDINPTFAANMALQVGVTLDNGRIKDLKTTGATLAEAGSSKQITYTVLPGRTLDTVIEVSVTDFRMDPITLNGIRMNLGFEVDTSSFKTQLSMLSEAIAQLDDGAGELKSGIVALSSGFDDYVSGVNQFNTGLSQLALSGKAMSLGASALSTNMATLTQQNETLKQGALAIQQATFDSINASLSGMGLPELTVENYALVLQGIPDLASVKAQLDGVVQFTQGLSAYLDGVVQLSLGATELTEGLAQYQGALELLAQSSTQLYQASVKLNAALSQLKTGLIEYKKGTGTLHQETETLDASIDEAIQEMISGFMGNGDPIVSFVSAKNTNVTSVQFVLKTTAIEAAEAEKPADPIPAKRNLWEKLIDLFSGLFSK